MTNSKVVGYPQEHTSFSSLQKITCIFHSPLHTCLVLSPILWEGECLSLFLWTNQSLEKKSVPQAFFFPKEGKTLRYPSYSENRRVSERESGFRRDVLACSQVPLAKLISEWEKDKDFCMLPCLQSKFIRLSTLCPEQRYLSTYTRKVTRYICTYLKWFISKLYNFKVRAKTEFMPGDILDLVWIGPRKTMKEN